MKRIAFGFAAAVGLLAQPAMAQEFDAVGAVDAQYDRTARVAGQLSDWSSSLDFVS